MPFPYNYPNQSFLTVDPWPRDGAGDPSIANLPFSLSPPLAGPTGQALPADPGGGFGSDNPIVQAGFLGGPSAQSADDAQRLGPFVPTIPPELRPGTKEWWEQARRGHQGLADFTARLLRKIIGGSEEERCRVERELCHQKCVDYAMGHPVPGIGGSDRPGHYRRCMRPCMEDANCPYE